MWLIGIFRISGSCGLGSRPDRASHTRARQSCRSCERSSKVAKHIPGNRVIGGSAGEDEESTKEYTPEMYPFTGIGTTSPECTTECAETRRGSVRQSVAARCESTQTICDQWWFEKDTRDQGGAGFEYI